MKLSKEITRQITYRLKIGRSLPRKGRAPNNRRALLENGRPWHLSMFSIMLSKYTSKSLASLAKPVWRTLESKQI
jgi:hypothetical protein